MSCCLSRIPPQPALLIHTPLTALYGQGNVLGCFRPNCAAGPAFRPQGAALVRAAGCSLREKELRPTDPFLSLTAISLTGISFIPLHFLFYFGQPRQRLGKNQPEGNKIYFIFPYFSTGLFPFTPSTPPGREAGIAPRGTAPSPASFPPSGGQEAAEGARAVSAG